MTKMSGAMDLMVYTQHHCWILFSSLCLTVARTINNSITTGNGEGEREGGRGRERERERVRERPTFTDCRTRDSGGVPEPSLSDQI